MDLQRVCREAEAERIKTAKGSKAHRSMKGKVKRSQEWICKGCAVRLKRNYK